MDRGDWQAPVHGVTKSQTRLKWLGTHYDTCVCICVYIYFFFDMAVQLNLFIHQQIAKHCFFWLILFSFICDAPIFPNVLVFHVSHRNTETHIYLCVWTYIYMDISICIRDIQPLDITSGMFCQYSLWIALFLNSVRFNSAAKRKKLHILYPTQPLPWIPSVENWKQSEIAVSTWKREKI